MFVFFTPFLIANAVSSYIWALSTFKDIALSDSVGWNISAVVDISCRALAVATHSATGAEGNLSGPWESGPRWLQLTAITYTHTWYSIQSCRILKFTLDNDSLWIVMWDHRPRGALRHMTNFATFWELLLKVDFLLTCRHCAYDILSLYT